MNYKQFKKAVSIIEDFYKEKETINENMKNLIVDDFYITVGDRSISTFISLLEDMVNDKGEWLQWFIYENEFGKKCLEMVNKEGTIHKIKTVKDLWKYCLGKQI